MSIFPVKALLSDPLFSENFGFGLSNSSAYMDWKETPEAHIFKIDLPGLTKEDVKLQVHDDRVLHISADRKLEDEDYDDKNTTKWHCKERVNAGTFSREFRLPENALVDQIKASMSDGLLVVTIPKDGNVKKKKHRKHAVEIAGEEEKSGSAKGLGRFVCCKA
ncbi:hypothetical protein ACJIZ3_012877 [Penstemon smallii]|uniref:SHSP domain-containing protein n=1 Tax=Penstemon smallii TaxID=265156 RepID=A0ABD3UPL8_9LAMI